MAFLTSAARGATAPMAGLRVLRSSGRGNRQWLLIGLAPLVVVAGLVIVLTILRGVLYPVVDQGPYDTSWGGPGLGGAWAVHVLIGVGCTVIALLVLSGFGRLRTALEQGRHESAVTAGVGALGVLGAGLLLLWVSTQLVPALTG